MNELCEGPILIKVWVGDPDTRIMPLTDYPLIRKCLLIGENDAYAMAGTGVVAGSNIYEYLWWLGVLAVWVEHPMKKSYYSNLGIRL